MKKGLIIGKFYPFHQGHISLIRFALQHCNLLQVLICTSDKENIAGNIRLQWLQQTFPEKKIELILLNYLEEELPNTSQSSRHVSMLWARKIKEVIGKVDMIFSSEKYGDYLAEYLNCKHEIFDVERSKTTISASQIRDNPFLHWDYIARAAQPYFVKKIAVLGTESTGKSTMTAKLATYFNTTYVPEMAREVIEETEDCTPKHLDQIAQLHARTINQKVAEANKILFVDTDVTITKSYARFLFNKELKVDDWIEEANNFDLYFYLNVAVPYVQDGTRLSETRRNELDVFHRKEMKKRKINYKELSGNWEERFEEAVKIINATFF